MMKAAISKEIICTSKLKILSVILFVIVTEVCLGVCLYLYISANFVSTEQMEQILLKCAIKTDDIQDDAPSQLFRKIARDMVLSRKRRVSFFK